MKKDILKIAGVKSEKDFYKKYPTEEAFMAEHGGKFKKAAMGKSMVNKQLIQLTDFANPPQAQEGWIGRAATANLNFWEKCMLSQGAGSKGAGMIGFDSQSSKYKNPYEEISDIKSYSKDERKAFEKSRPQDVELSDWVAFNRDASRMNALLRNPDYNKYTDATGTLKPEYQNSATQFDPYYLYYKPAFADKKSVTPEDIMKFQQSQPEGISGYRELVNRRYMPKKEYGGDIPQARMGNYISSLPPQFQFETYDPYRGNVSNNPTYNRNTGMIGSQTGQVSMADTQSLGFNDDGTKTLGRTIKDLNANDIKAGVQLSSTIGKNIQKVGQAIKEKRQAKQLRALAPIIQQASGTRPEQMRRRYVRPEDMLVNPGEVAPSYGTGYSFLQMEDGGIINQIGGNPTEIQNMYNPGNLYNDLGYEPLGESASQVKQFKKGGEIPKAQVGEIMGAAQEIFNVSGDQIAGLISLGTNRLNKQSMQMLNQAGFQSGMQGLQDGQYSAFMKDGGWVSNDWQPQVIAKFGDYDVKDLLAPPKDADMLRAGGHLKEYTAPSERAMSTERPMMQMGGELQTYWGGDAEVISENPYLPDGGETVMFRGQSHDEADGKGRTGIGITFGDSPVEVERGEPAVKLKDGGTGDDSLVVYGNMMIPSYGVSELNDPKAKGKKFKSYVADLSKLEQKANKTSEKALDILENTNGTNQYDLLAMSTADAMMKGSDMKLKEVAMKKQIAAGVQNAILETAEERGLDSDALAKGKIKKAKGDGTAQVGRTVPSGMLFSDRMNPVNTYNELNPRILDRVYPPLMDVSELDVRKPTAAQSPVAARRVIANNVKKSVQPALPARAMATVDMKELPEISAPTKIQVPQSVKEMLKEKAPTPSSTESNFDWTDAYNMLYPLVRPGIRNPLAPSQLAPEMLALATNQLEPVQAQLYRPMLEQAPTVSFQDRLNEIQADVNASKRMVGNNPAALAAIDAQASRAKNQVLGEQFRTNQMIQMDSRRRNLSTLNDATLKNLSILDQQFVRQAQAKSATKAQAFEALSGIADKIARNKAETLQANVMANMYPQFTYGPQGRIFNTGMAKFNIPTIADYTYEDLQKMADAKKAQESKKKTTARNGSIVKAIKNL